MRRDRDKNKKKQMSWSTILAIFLAIIGVVLLFADSIRNYVLMEQVKSQTQSILTISAEELEENRNKEVTYNFEEIDAVSIQSVLEATTNRTKIPTIGMISVPSVGINLTIVKGVSNINMLVGAGTLTANQKMGEGNYSLASHYLDSSFGENLLFTPLPKVKLGEKIYLTDLENIYEYEVFYNELVEPTRVDLIEEVPNKKIVTLITCGEQGAMRYVIQGELKQIIPMDEADTTLKGVFGLETKTFK